MFKNTGYPRRAIVQALHLGKIAKNIRPEQQGQKSSRSLCPPGFLLQARSAYKQAVVCVAGNIPSARNCGAARNKMGSAVYGGSRTGRSSLDRKGKETKRNTYGSDILFRIGECAGENRLSSI